MKKKIVLSILSIFLIPSIFIGCMKDNKDDSTKEDTTIEDTVKDEDNSESDVIGDESSEETVNDEANEDTSSQVDQNLSYTPKTIEYAGGKIDIPSDWTEYDLSAAMKIYVFSNAEGNANILSNTTMGLSPDEYMQAAKDSVLQTLNIKDKAIDIGSNDVNGTTVYYFEYAQDTPQGSVYTYQPTVFINDTVHILTIGSINQELIDENKELFHEIATTMRE